MPFDLTRLAQGWSEARYKFRGGFSLQYLRYRHPKTRKYRASRYRPPIRIKHIDSKRSFIGFTQPSRDPDHRAKENFLESRFFDLRMPTFALTNVGYSLKSAGKAFGNEHQKTKADAHGIITETYIDYNRNDVLATFELFLKVRDEFNRDPIDLDPCRAYSPATIAKAYLKAMGLNSPVQKFRAVPEHIQGLTMTAYFGGRSEAAIRKMIVPVVYADFSSMYPRVNKLLRLWSILTAEHLKVVDATDQVRELLSRVTLDRCFEQSLWPHLLFFARIEPDKDVVPVRAEYGGVSSTLNIAVSEFSSSKTFWYAGPDLVASVILSGKVPKVVQAFVLVPEGQQNGLKPIKLRGSVPVDPRTDDFFHATIEQRLKVKASSNSATEESERLQKFLKVLANSGSYGIFAEMNPEELAEEDTATVTVYGLGKPFKCETSAPEDPGKFFFAPIAALIPAAARLMLALVERCVTNVGGTYAFCDRDSMAIVASETGESIEGLPARVLTLNEADQIIARFSSLNPSDGEDGHGSILRMEKENWDDSGKRVQLHCLCISAKRYALFTRNAEGGIKLVKCSQHGLGHLLTPLDPDEEPSKPDEPPEWIKRLWQIMIRRAQGENPEPPEWIDRRALSRVTATRPEIVRRLNQAKRRASYANTIKPGNFVLAAHIMPMGHPEGVDPEKFQLIALYTTDARKWLWLPWIDRNSGRTFAITTRATADGHVARVKSFRHVLEEYVTHPEPKRATQDGRPCSRSDRGLLKRRHIQVASLYYVGKESNFLEDVEFGVIHDPDEVQQKYLDPCEDHWLLYVVPVLRLMPRPELAQGVEISERFVQYLRNPKPSRRRRPDDLRAKLTRMAARFARMRLGPGSPLDDVAACAAFVQLDVPSQGARSRQ